jgi:hypothetical protein
MAVNIFITLAIFSFSNTNDIKKISINKKMNKKDFELFVVLYLKTKFSNA